MTLEVDARLEVGAFALDARFSASAGVTVLFGPTASGKSLTLRLVAGLERARDGSVRFDGAPFDDGRVATSPSLRGVGYAPQHSALWPHRTVLEHVQAFASEARAREVLERVGLEKLADRRPERLSGGERQRLAFARAIARSPKLLLLDEPFSALHDEARAAMGRLVRELGSAGATILFVTHDRAEAERVADAVVTFAEGQARPGTLNRP